MHRTSRSGPDHGDSSGTSSGSKRTFEKVIGDNVPGAPAGEKRQKLPALASVVVEAVKMDSLQKICSAIEPIIRKVVGEEVERAFARLVPPNRLGARTTPIQIQESPVSDLRLDFTTKLSLPLFTGGKVEGEKCLPMLIVLKNATTGQVLTTGPASNTKLEVVVLDGDFTNDDEEWSFEEFENHVVKEREGKRPLLTGDLTVTLKEGVGSLGELSFTDNSSWIRSRKFRLGVRVAPGFCEGTRVQECKTDAFVVKDHRGELYKKHYPPRLSDEVWRLEKIGKDGAFHKKLQHNKINTVEEFLRCYVRDHQKLRNTLGSGMSNRMWEVTVEHAKTCILSGKLYVYYPDSSQRIGVIFNDIYMLMGVTSNNTYKQADNLTDDEKVYVDKLVKVAYENWGSVTEYESGTLGSETGRLSSARSIESEASIGSKEQDLMYPTLVGLSQQPDQFQNISSTTSIPASNATPQLYGYGAEPSSRYGHQDHEVNQSIQLYNSGGNPHGHGHTLPSISLRGGSTSNEHGNTALGPTQSSVSRHYGGYPPMAFHPSYQGSTAEWPGFAVQNPLTPAVDIFSNEEDIRARMEEMLGHDEMQQLLRQQNLPYPENFHLQGDETYFSAYAPPAVSYGDDGVRSSGKAYVGWLKLKAALRWGIFIRKKIEARKAIKRAQLEEIED